MLALAARRRGGWSDRWQEPIVVLHSRFRNRWAVRAVATGAGVVLSIGLAAQTASAGSVSGSATSRTGSSRAGSTVASRPYASLVTLADGRQLMAGGCAPGHCPSITTEADLYDPVSRTWTVTTPMLAPSAASGAVLLRDGRVLIAAGCTSRLCGGMTSTAQIFDPTSRTWTSTGSLPWASRYLQAVLLTDGRVLAAGGQGGATQAALYDPTSGRWSSTTGMGVDRAHFTLTVLRGGDVLAAGGCGGYYCQTGNASSETYSSGTGTWRAAGAMRRARQDHTATLQPSGQVRVQGGVDTTNQPVTPSESYDPTTRSWS